MDKRKLAIGYCQYPGCGREVTEKTVRSFQYHHVDKATKATSKTLPQFLTGKLAGVGGLVQNVAKRAALKFTHGVIDTECHLCILECVNCHVGREERKRGRWDESPPAHLLSK